MGSLKKIFLGVFLLLGSCGADILPKTEERRVLERPYKNWTEEKLCQHVLAGKEDRHYLAAVNEIHARPFIKDGFEWCNYLMTKPNQSNERGAASLPVGVSQEKDSYLQATSICRPQAELASEQAAASYTPRRSRLRTYDVSCSEYGRYSVNCSARDMTPTGGKWAGINEALEKKRLKDKTYNAVFDSCMAQMGHF